MAESNKNQVNVVSLKPQYIAKGENNDNNERDAEDGETPDKKAKLENQTNDDAGKKNKNRKFNKNPRFRGRERNTIYENLCKTLIDVPVNAPMPVCESIRCKYLHDVNKFLQTKPPDIGEECHVFKLKGHCPRGISCRFGSKHITENGRNIVNETVKAHYEKNVPKTLAFYSKEVENDLRKRTYDFKKSEEVLDALPKAKPPPPVPSFGPFNPPFWGPGNDIDFTEDVDVPAPPTVAETIPPLIEEGIGPCPDDDLFKAHLAEKKKIVWKDKLYLAPLANFGNLPFRRICKEFGADVTCSELVVATSILQWVQIPCEKLWGVLSAYGIKGSVEGHKIIVQRPSDQRRIILGFYNSSSMSQPFEWLLTKRHETEDLFGVQLLGNNPFAMTRCAQLLEEQTNIDFLDLSIGRPEDMMFRPRGVTQLRREKVVETIVRCVSRVSSLPISVSTWLGDYSDEKVANKFLPNYKACQVSLMIVQGRNRETKEVDWAYINNLSHKVSPVSVFGLSDVVSCSDYFHIKENFPDVTGCLIGRGALVKPWLFTELKQRRNWDISSGERFEILKKFVNYGLEHWGSDTKGVESTRKFLLDWLSILCRYIPLGLLEHPPQKINDKSPKFIGRDDMETLLGSQNPSDWVKISEMLLGPYPENQQFVPRIKPSFWPIDS